ncbi:MAG: DegT/DnrJ/EryC1/StrS aminotransferase family protein, partial [Candidatus Taylorbacteria bacterium]|nr:DegT/DnrJ/EryC1/StrS aminotransferase family protein [Candidatus Taylorbacteria bacterium]
MQNDFKNKMIVPVNEPAISKEAKENVATALSHGWISSAGPFVGEFEDAFAKYIGVQHAVSVSNGTAALHIALLALGIGKGDEVIVPAFSMGACFLSVLYSGAKPVFVDCELETYNIDPNKIEEKISPKTKALMLVHTYGHACDIDAIQVITKKYGLKIIEDAAEAHGATYKG